MTDRIERDVLIAAPVERVWELITRRVETIEPPHRFAYRWLTSDDAQEATPGNSTLVEFTLAAEGDKTRVALVESGFDGLDLGADERAARFAAHTRGWPMELTDLVDHATGATAAR